MPENTDSPNVVRISIHPEPNLCMRLTFTPALAGEVTIDVFSVTSDPAANVSSPSSSVRAPVSSENLGLASARFVPARSTAGRPSQNIAHTQRSDLTPRCTCGEASLWSNTEVEPDAEYEEFIVEQPNVNKRKVDDDKSNASKRARFKKN